MHRSLQESSQETVTIIIIIIMCGVYVHLHIFDCASCHSTCEKLTGKHPGASSLLLPSHEFWGSNSGQQANMANSRYLVVRGELET